MSEVTVEKYMCGEGMYVINAVMDRSLIVATMLVAISEDGAYVDDVSVSEGYRRRGYAKLLFNFLDVWAYTSEHDITLMVAESNLPAVNLYESLGFETLVVIPNFQGHCKNMLVMRKHR